MSGEAVAARCTLALEGAVVTVPVGATRRVCYEFDTRATNADLALRYAVEVNGLVDPAHAKKPAALSASNRKVDLQVAPGSKVALYLNSDASPDFRQRAVYALTVGERDVVVKITERKGRLGHERSTLSAPECLVANGKLIDLYQAALTGDIWMEISHVYTVAEAAARLPDDLPSAAREAVLRIYAGLVRPELLVQLPASDSRPGLTLLVKFLEQETVSANTTSCPLLSSVLPRVHPAAYAALISAAHAAGVTVMQVNSGWRPSFGSIAHRAGLGLDVQSIESGVQHVSINRAVLIGGRGPGDYVTLRERELYTDYENKKREADAAEKEYRRLNQLSGTPSERLDSAKQHKDDSAAARDDALKNWNRERDQHEPKVIRSLRDALSLERGITQILDPWYVDLNTRDPHATRPNEQRSELEKYHNNHLHITIKEERIL